MSTDFTTAYHYLSACPTTPRIICSHPSAIQDHHTQHALLAFVRVLLEASDMVPASSTSEDFQILARVGQP